MQKITEGELQDMFDEYLTENYEPYEIAGVTLYPAVMLKRTDPIAYRTSLANYADYLSRDGYEVEGY